MVNEPVLTAEPNFIQEFLQQVRNLIDLSGSVHMRNPKVGLIQGIQRVPGAIGDPLVVFDREGTAIENVVAVAIHAPTATL